MTVQSSDFGGSPYKLGDVRPLPLYSRLGYFTEDGQEWLRTGLLRANTGNAYAELVAAAPGYGVNYNVPADRVGNFGVIAVNGSLIYSRVVLYRTTAGRYLLAPPPSDAGSNMVARSSPDLTTAGTSVALSTTACTGHCLHNGIVLFCTTDGTASTGLKNFDTVIGSGTGYTAQSYAGVASNGTNLAVAIARGVSSNVANCIQTSTDGGSWVPRAGSNGALQNMVGIHYAPHPGKFFKWGGSSADANAIAILSAADRYTDTLALSADVNYKGQISTVYGGMQHGAASTPTATLIPVQRVSDSMYGWLKTTNGTTWTFVSPHLDPAGSRVAHAVTALFDLQYDAQRSRLVAFAATPANSGDCPAYYFSTDDGATWQGSPGFDDADPAVTKFLGFSYAGSQDVAHVGLNSGAPYLYSYPAAKFGTTPSYVGTISTHFVDSAAAKVAYSIRIK